MAQPNGLQWFGKETHCTGDWTMCWDQYWRKLYAFQGYVVKAVKVSDHGVIVDLRRDGRCHAACPRCGASMRVNRSDVQAALDIPLRPGTIAQLRYEAIQGFCCACKGYATVHPPGIDARARATDRFKRHVSFLCRFMPVSHVAEQMFIAASTAYRWDKQILEQTLPEPDLDDLEILLVDEKSVRKYFGYMTLVMNAKTGELLHFADGKKKASLQSFFDRLSAEQRARIKAVAMDRNGAYYRVVKEAIPDALIVYDKFHVMASFHKVIDRVRNDEFKKARAEDKAVIKGQRFNLFRSPERRTESQTQTLKALFALNENLNKMYLLKEALKQLWNYRYPAWARRYFERWKTWAREASIPALDRFAKNLTRDTEELIAYCKYPITIARLEGFNNTVSRLIHRACGVRDMEYFYLKLRQESLAGTLQK